MSHDAGRTAERFLVLDNLNKIVDYTLACLGKNHLPNYVRYGLGNFLLPALMQVGGLLFDANRKNKDNYEAQLRNIPQPHKPWDIVKIAREARASYDNAKYALRFLSQREEIKSPSEKHVAELMGEFERSLEGWLRVIKPGSGKGC